MTSKSGISLSTAALAESMTQKECLQICSANIKIIVNSMIKQLEVTAAAKNTAGNVLKNMYNVDEKRKELIQRLIALSDAIENKKREMMDMIMLYNRLTGRIVRIATTMSENPKAVKDEKKYREELNNFMECIKFLKNDLHDASMRAASMKSKFIRTAIPFHASAQAQKFMMSKIEHDVNKVKQLALELEERLSTLEDDFPSN